MNNQDSWSVPGVKVAVGGAVVLAISCFLPWWDQGGGFGDFQEAATGSSMVNAFETPIGALIAIGCAIGVIFIAMKVKSNPGLAVQGFNKFGIVALGAIAALVVVLGIASPPEPTAFGESLADPASPAFGIWIALVASGAIIYGGYQIYRLYPGTSSPQG